MKTKRKTFFIFILLVLLLVGCKNKSKNNNYNKKEKINEINENKEKPTKEEIKKYINNKYEDNSEIILISKTTNEDTYMIRSSLGFDYYLYTGIYFYNGYYKRYYNDTLYKELIQNEKVHVDSIFNKYDKIKATYKIDNKVLYFNIEYDNKKNIDIVCNFLYDIRNLFLLYGVKNGDDIKITIIDKENNISYNKIKFSDIDKNERSDYLNILIRNIY